jgi:hypothetical protein
LLVCCSYTLTLKMEAAHPSEILVNFYQTTWHHIQQNSSLHGYFHENLRADKIISIPHFRISHTPSSLQVPSLINYYWNNLLILLICCFGKEILRILNLCIQSFLPSWLTKILQLMSWKRQSLNYKMKKKPSYYINLFKLISRFSKEALYMVTK